MSEQREETPALIELGEALRRAGQIMRGDVQREEQKTMTTDEIRAAKRKLENEINDLLDRFQQEAGAGVWVESVDLQHAGTIGQMAPIVAAVKVDVRLR